MYILFQIALIILAIFVLIHEPLIVLALIVIGIVCFFFFSIFLTVGVGSILIDFLKNVPESVYGVVALVMLAFIAYREIKDRGKRRQEFKKKLNGKSVEQYLFDQEMLLKKQQLSEKEQQEKLKEDRKGVRLLMRERYLKKNILSQIDPKDRYNPLI